MEWIIGRIGSESYINYYFNVTLKTSWELPEEFTIQSIGNKVIIQSNNNQSKLLNIIRETPAMKKYLINVLIAGLSHFNISHVEMNISDRLELFFFQWVDLDVPVWAIIYSYLELSDLRSLESIKPEITSDVKFWIEIFKQKFHKYYKPYYVSNNWSEFYITLYKFLFPGDYNEYAYLSEYKELKRYLIFNNLVDLSDDEMIGCLFDTTDVEINKVLFEKYTEDLDLNSELMRVLDDVSLAELSPAVLIHTWDHMNEFGRDKIYAILDCYNDQDEMFPRTDTFSPEICQIICDRMFRCCISLKPLEKILQFIFENIFATSKDCVEYLLREYSEITKNDITKSVLLPQLNCLVYDYHLEAYKVIFNKSRKMLSKSDINHLLEIIRENLLSDNMIKHMNFRLLKLNNTQLQYEYTHMNLNDINSILDVHIKIIKASQNAGIH